MQVRVRSVKKEKKLGNLLTWLATYYSERLAIQYSDTIIALNERDNPQSIAERPIISYRYRLKTDSILPGSTITLTPA